MALRAWNVVQPVNFICSQETAPCDWHRTQACATCATTKGLIEEKTGICITCWHDRPGNKSVFTNEKALLHQLMYLNAQIARKQAVGIEPEHLPRW